MKIAIHTVFILKENALFIEEWIQHHLELGFNRFYLYDNSKVEVPGDFDKKNKDLVPGKVNKYNVNYENFVIPEGFLKDLVKKYPCVKITEWSPKNKDGKITYAQEMAHAHCLQIMKQDKIDWCANIDIDEFIISQNIRTYISELNPKVSNIKLGQVLFDSRFNNLNIPVKQIRKASKNQPQRSHSNKNIYKVYDTFLMSVHDWAGRNACYKPDIAEIWFNHYKLNESDYVFLNNIP